MRSQHLLNLQTMYYGSNFPNAKPFDKVFVQVEDCYKSSLNCNLSTGGLIFDSWNDDSSCGMQEGQEVWVCYSSNQPQPPNYVYVVLEDCETECSNYSCIASNIYFVSQCIMCLMWGMCVFSGCG